VIQNPGFLPDHAQNWITCSLCHARHTLKILERSIHNFLSYLVHTHTDRQTKTGKNITSLAEVKISAAHWHTVSVMQGISPFVCFAVFDLWVLNVAINKCINWCFVNLLTTGWPLSSHDQTPWLFPDILKEHRQSIIPRNSSDIKQEIWANAHETRESL